MNRKIRNLEPKGIWNNFSDLNAVPRPSKKEEKVIQFMKNFGLGLGLETIVDEIGNVIIKKPGSPGREDHSPVILQSHLDMVCQKNNDTIFDFDTQGIKMIIEEDWVRAEGTTLGADNGIGVATIMTLLEANDIAHPPLEALFTIDEETGMTGAMALKPGLLDGKVLLNLDSEDDEEITIGCAGGIDVNISKKYISESFNGDYTGYKLRVKGLKGGHSGMDIHLGRGNANKIMNRLLWIASKVMDIRIANIDGGGLRNAIPRESNCILAIASNQIENLLAIINDQYKILKIEHNTTDPNLEIELSPIETPLYVLSSIDQISLLNAIYSCQNGIYRMSPDVENLVQTSNNLARVSVENGNINIMCLTRGAVDSEKDDLANNIEACFNNINAQVEKTGSYPGWAPEPQAKINQVLANTYSELFSDAPAIMACHAGLECGIIKKAYPDVDMISFGPNIRGAHSPDERVQISSVQKFWKLLLKVLEQM